MLRFQGLKKGYLKAKGRKVILKNGLLQGNPEGSKKYNQWEGPEAETHLVLRSQPNRCHT